MKKSYKLSASNRLNYVERASSVAGPDKKIKIKSKILSLFLLFLLIFSFAYYYARYEKRIALQKEIELVQEKVYEYEKINSELHDLVSYLDSDQAIEESARVNFGLKKPGENAVVVQLNDRIDQLDVQVEKQTIDDNFSKKWFKYFFE